MSRSRDWNIIDDELARKMKQVQELRDSYDDQTEQLLRQEQQQDYNSEINYYKEFWKYYILNEMAIKKVNDLHMQNQKLSELTDEIDNLQSELQQALSQRHKKKNRRTAVQIEKSYECPYEKCNKQYGSDVSLNLHIKLKHDGGNKTDREKFAKMIIEAQENGEQIPDLNIKFPPGYLEVFYIFFMDQQFQKQLQQDKKKIFLE
ncbi:hypothetical protein pb186bvf_009625 [Paramecium bursaria]